MFANLGESIYQFITYQYPSEDVRLVGSIVCALLFGLVGTQLGLKIYNRYYSVPVSNYNSKYSERFRQYFKNWLASFSRYGGMIIIGAFFGILVSKYPVILMPVLLIGIPAIDAF